MFGSNLALVVGLYLLFGACGWWAVSPFRRQFPFALAQAPLAGMLLLPMSVLALMVVLHFRFDRALVVASVLLSSATAVSAWRGRDSVRASAAFLGSVALVASTAAVWFLTSSDLYFGVPALGLAHGTDHLGYARIADWLRGDTTYVVTPAPTDWYRSYSHYSLAVDPRYGSFALLGIVSAISGRSGAFSYDLCSAVAIPVGVLAVAAVFARRRSTFLLLVAALFTGYWFDWNRGGYLGKTGGYPASFFVAGLVLFWIDRARRSPERPLFDVAALIALTAGAALIFSGLITAMVLTLVAGLFILCLAAARRRSPEIADCGALRDAITLVAILAAVAILTSGIIARPLFAPGNIPIPWSWWDLLSRAAEFDGLIPGRTLFPRGVITMLMGATLLAAILLLSLGVAARSFIAVPLIATPLLILCIVVPAGFKWHAMVFMGLYVPLLLCGTVVLMDDASTKGFSKPWRTIVTVIAIAMIALRLPRFEATVRFHRGREFPAQFRFSSAEIDALAAAIEREGGVTFVDLEPPHHFASFLLVELGRRGIDVQWSERSWRQVLRYRPWPVPSYDKPAPLKIQMRGKSKSPAIAQTTQFELVRR
jgi:hypothetical protein